MMDEQKTIADMGRQAIQDNSTINKLRAEVFRLRAELGIVSNCLNESNRELARWHDGAQHEQRTASSLDAVDDAVDGPDFALDPPISPI